MTKIYHNPRCRKSRETLQILEDNAEQIEIVEYLKDSPSKAELTEIVSLLGISPIKLIRRGEKVFKEEFKGKELNDEEWIDAMVANPIIIERPIVVKNGKAALGRPPEQVLDIL
ncbi:MAG: arsenate reductase (glutaredoxin) [Cyclobacteriaceae bacterium]